MVGTHEQVGVDGTGRRRWSRVPRTGAAWLAVTALMAGSLAACSPDPPGPEGAAKALSDALTSGDFADVTLVGASATDAAAQRTAAYAGLAPWTPQV